MRFFWCVIAPLLANVLIFFLLLWKAKSHLVVKLEYLSAALTAATLVLTGVAIVVAILAVFGYREIRERSEAAAVKRAEEMIHGAVVDAATPLVARLLEQALTARRAEERGEERGDEVMKASKEEI